HAPARRDGGGGAGRGFVQPFRPRVLGTFPRLSGWLELLGAVRAGRDGGADRGRQVRPVLVAGNTHLGNGGRLLRPHQPDQSYQRQGIRRGRVLVRHHQGGGRHRHDPAGTVFAVQRQGRGAGGLQQPLAPRWLLPKRPHGHGDGAGIIMFSFGGLELVGITAAEAAEPRKVIPKAINQVVYRILIFYIGALTVLLALYPWDALVATLGAAGDPYSGSPFVLIFSLIGSDTAAHVLNFVVLTAALSVYNSGVYCNSRVLYGLAEQGDAPKALLGLNRRGVPVLAVGLSALVTLLCVAINYLLPQTALTLLMSLVVDSLVLYWFMISLTHLR